MILCKQVTSGLLQGFVQAPLVFSEIALLTGLDSTPTPGTSPLDQIVAFGISYYDDTSHQVHPSLIIGDDVVLVKAHDPAKCSSTKRIQTAVGPNAPSFTA